MTFFQLLGRGWRITVGLFSLAIPQAIIPVASFRHNSMKSEGSMNDSHNSRYLSGIDTVAEKRSGSRGIEVEGSGVIGYLLSTSLSPSTSPRSMVDGSKLASIATLDGESSQASSIRSLPLENPGWVENTFAAILSTQPPSGTTLGNWVMMNL